MATGNFNMEDPAKQEAIRRQHHEYVPTAGKHGSYVPRQYKHQEFPKMMGKFPRPELKQFEGPDAPQKLELAMAEWNRRMEATTVNSKAEELQWLKENG